MDVGTPKYFNPATFWRQSKVSNFWPLHVLFRLYFQFIFMLIQNILYRKERKVSVQIIIKNNSKYCPKVETFMKRVFLFSLQENTVKITRVAGCTLINTIFQNKELNVKYFVHYYKF